MKPCFRFACAAVLSISFPCWSRAQSYPNVELFQPPFVLPKTPDAAGLYKFEPFAVDYPSGTVNVTIPIYTIQSGRIKVPISISYNTNGNKVQDIASMVGLGWSLNFGDNISIEQEEQKPLAFSTRIYKNANTAQTMSNNLPVGAVSYSFEEEMRKATDGYYQEILPVYHFRCGQYKGDFIIDTLNNIQVTGIYGNIQITPIHVVPNNPTSAITGFAITTDDGLRYIFDQAETTMRLSQASPPVGPETTVYWVSSIIDLTTGETVSFQYNKKPVYINYQNEVYNERYLATGPISGCPWSPNYVDPNNLTYGPVTVTPYQINGLQISNIYFRGGHVSFASDTTFRKDIEKTRISEIDVWGTVSGQYIKRAVFAQDQFYSTINTNSIPSQYFYRLKLEGVSFYQLQGSSPVETYGFQYNEGTPLPSYRKIDLRGFQVNNTSVDYWGYYNGSTYGDGLVPANIRTQFLNGFAPNGVVGANPQYSGAVRTANSYFTQACILNKVTYPTGGYAVFSYENHRSPGYYLGDTLGGLRVKSISYYDNINTTTPSVQQNLTYQHGYVLTPASFFMYCYQKSKVNVEPSQTTPGYYPCGSYDVLSISGTPLYDIAYYHGSPILYDSVEEFDGRASNNGKIDYTFNYAAENYYPTAFKELGNLKLVPGDQDYSRGQLLTKSVYRNNNNPGNPYTLLSKQVNTYGGGGGRYIQIGLGVMKVDSWDLVGPGAISWYETCASNPPTPGTYIGAAFIFNDYHVPFGYSVPVKQESYGYDDNGGSIYTVKNFYYDNPANSLLTRVETINSKGDTLRTQYKYLQDSSLITDKTSAERAAIATLAGANVNKFNDVLEEADFKHDTLIVRKRRVFWLWFSSTLGYSVPYVKYYNQQNYVNDQTDVQSTSVNAYDKYANVLEQQVQSNGAQFRILDDYALEGLAEVKNASSGEAFYTSFEAGERGNWQYSGSVVSDTTCPTGFMCYNLSTGNLTAAGLVAQPSYVVSYWSKNGSYTVTGSTSLVTGPTVRGWTYYQHTVSAPTVSISGTGYIDEVRLYPPTAQMVTYCYYPMIGPISRCDEKNQITYYTYDSYGRLRDVKDQYHNVIKVYDYEYQSNNN